MTKGVDESKNLPSALTQSGGETVQIAPEDKLFAGDTVQIGAPFDSELDHNTTVVDKKAEDFSTEIALDTGLASQEPDANALVPEIIADESINTSQPSGDSAAQPVSERSFSEPVENEDTALRPNRLRTALIYGLFAFTGLWLVINVYQSSRIQTEIVDWKTTHRDGRLVIDTIDSKIVDKLTIGDEITALDGEAVTRNGRLRQLLERLKPEQTYILQIKPGDGAAVRQVELVAPPGSVIVELNKYLVNLIIPITFFLCGLIVFFFKPDNKLVVLMAMTFALMTIAVPVLPLVMPELSPPFNVIWSVGTVIGFIFAPIIFHLHSVFPEPSNFIRRFPIFEKLLYLPCLLLSVPIAAMWHLSLNGFSWFDFSIDRPIFTQLLFLPHTAYLLGTLVILMVNYFLTDAIGKRRVRLYAAGAFLSVAMYLFDKLLRPIEYAFNFRLYGDDGFRYFLTLAPTMFLPIALAYAITRHKVIPVSFVIRRGLQYLLAKNALRLLLLLPVLALLWNVAANPERRIDEILMRNSTGFYICIVLAAVLIAVNRFGLREWIDRRFFRKQYKQEVILRDLGEAIQESDSISTLSRLVSDKIDAALHPSSIYLFFKSDASDSDFSLSYTSTGAGSADFKIDADSPVLRFLQTERRAIDFADANTGDLPRAEERWLRSLGASLLVPMHGTDRKLAGFFTLGEKLSEIPYTGGDKQLLTSLANQIALIHENLTLKDRVRQEQKIRTEVLSRVDAASLNLLKECPKCGRCFDRIEERCSDDNAELTFTLPVERTIEKRYRLEKLLGKGAMGAVYEATDKRINRLVAVKILSGAMFGNRDALRRFQREAQTAGRVHHPNIVTIFDYGVLTTEGAFLVMEIVRGRSLRQVLDREKTLKHETVVEWFGQVLDGIEAAHAAGIIHRDLKPANIVVTEKDGEPARLAILDFGLAREQELTESVTVPGTILGTFGYMPPEQLRGEQSDERSDLFAIAVMIYEAVHGDRPFQGKSYHELLRSMSETQVFYINKKWAAFFRRGLAVDRKRRYSKAGKMKEALKL